MPDMSTTQVRMPEQPADIRIGNFDEVALGYDEDMAAREAARCLNCKTSPCAKGCPVHIDINGFIQYIVDGDFDKAFDTISESNALPAICGRVCPQETQCEELCIRGKKGEPVAIGKLERYVADRRYARTGDAGDKSAGAAVDDSKHAYSAVVSDKAVIPADTAVVSDKAAIFAEAAVAGRESSRKVAVVGSGPASLTCAGNLAKYGYRVKIFESFHLAGGVLTYGIPEFRLPKKIVRQEIDMLLAGGVEIEYDMVVGKTISLNELFDDGYEAIFIGTGAGLPAFLNIPGENLCGVYSANEFLTRINLMRGYLFPLTDTPVRRGHNVAVIGGGNVALDAARCAKRLGAENVYIVYRRSEKEMPARAEEIAHARDEGIIFRMLTNPVRMYGDDDGWVRGVECERMELGEPDASGRKRPVRVAGSEFPIEADVVVVAIGQTPNPIIKNSTPELKSESWGGIVADPETGETSMKGVFAGGDDVTGAATVILAMGAGKSAAASIDKYLRELPVQFKP